MGLLEDAEDPRDLESLATGAAHRATVVAEQRGGELVGETDRLALTCAGGIRLGLARRSDDVEPTGG